MASFSKNQVIHESSEWRTFNNSDSVNTNHSGDPENSLLNDRNLSTIIGPRTGAPKYRKRKKPRYFDRSRITTSQEISAIANRINLSKAIIDRANNLFRQVQGPVEGRSNDAKASACLYIACRQEGVPHALKEICNISKISKKVIGRCFRICLKLIGTDVDFITTADFMNRFCSSLNLSLVLQCVANYIAQKAVDMGVAAGRLPISIAAAAIYMASQASNEKRTQKEIAVISGIAVVTIRKSYKELLPHARKLFPENFIFTTPIELLPKK